MKTSTDCLIVCVGAAVMGVLLTPSYSIVALILTPVYFICRAVEDKMGIVIHKLEGKQK